MTRVKNNSAKKLLLAMAASIAFFVDFSVVAKAVSSQRMVIDEIARSISICDNATCKPLKLTDSLLDEWRDGSITLDDMNLDGKLEVVVTGNGEVNRCSTAYVVDSFSRTLMAMKIDPLCNYRIERGYLISSYRLDAKSFEDVYKIRRGKFILYITDGCLDCDYVSRTIRDHGRVTTSLVSNANGFQKRTPQKAIVSAKKAALYSSPDDSKHTKGYLVAGDEVSLIEYADQEDRSWFYIQYDSVSGSVTRRWMREEDLKLVH